jgi:hypothetical protein
VKIYLKIFKGFGLKRGYVFKGIFHENKNQKNKKELKVLFGNYSKLWFFMFAILQKIAEQQNCKWKKF